MTDARILDYWEAFLATRADAAELRARGYVAEAFGDGAEMASELGALIVSGVKTATCSSTFEWEHAGDPIPHEGLLSIVLDGAGAPLCIIETLRVEIVAYEEVGPEFAYAEGEGDRSLEHWRRVHWAYFSRALRKLGLEPSASMPLVCEHFRVIHR
jgi:uncharacterized protein YhfF